MFKNYFLTAIRNFGRNTGFSIINILGLSIGIACCFILLLIVRFELSYDRYHEDVDRIYRVEKISNIYGETEKYAAIPRCVGDAIAQLEEVDAMGRFGSLPASARTASTAVRASSKPKVSLRYIAASSMGNFPYQIEKRSPNRRVFFPQLFPYYLLGELVGTYVYLHYLGIPHALLYPVLLGIAI